MKPLLAYAGAEAGMLSPGHHVTCNGTYGAFHCFAKHGDLGLSGALEVSCNTYFYELSEHMGLDRVRDAFSAFGLGRPTGLAPDEAKGQVPSDEQLKAAAGKESGWPLLVGIGHGPFGVTPLQLANAYAMLVGKLREHPEQGTVYDEIRVGLRQAVAGEHGTARAAAVDGLPVAGKTGTAQGDLEKPDEAEPMSGWFVGYAPADAPKVVVVVVVEGGPGGKTAAPIARDILAAWHQAR
jgi:penicillin-binding protein 2